MKATLIPVLALALSALPTFAADVNISGKWAIHTSIAGNENDLDCNLTQSGSELTGKCTSERGEVQLAGKVDDKKVSFAYKSEYNGTPLTVVFNGSIGDKKMSGSVDVPEFSVSGDFTAKAK